ncbi:S-type pyocin domain-containing protein [Pseudomonas sp. 18173]|uniref:S-type pyocin domain-containing protein n=1 Tax=Pseudomonas sp. 18173 TaxID=3390055 RepID=UPI003D222C20
MAQHIFNDGSSGSVVIRSGPPASGGGSGGGWGGGAGNRVGASGNFGGLSAKKKNARKRALQQHRAEVAQAEADDAAAAREQARIQTRQQHLAALGQRHGTVRAELDRSFAARITQDTQALEREIQAVRKPYAMDVPVERWILYSVSKDKSEIDGLIAHKTAQLNEKNATALSFDGLDPLTRSLNDYLLRLEQFGEALGHGHQLWENAYNAAHEASLLRAQLNALNEKSNALARDHAIGVQRLAAWEKQRQFVEQREARVRFKQLSDADARIERARQANTLHIPATASMAAASVLFNPNGVWIAGAADGLALAVSRSLVEVGSVLGTLTVGQAAIFIAGMTYPSELGNGELTPEQRARLFHAVAVPAQALDLYDRHELQTAADAGGTVELEQRLKPVAVPQGTAIVVVPTGGEIDSRVAVVNAALDPLTGLYSAEIPGSPARHLQFAPEAMPQAVTPVQAPLTVTEPQIQDIPAGVDLRIHDCIVCVPGLPPTYVSFSVPPLGTGTVSGTGQPAPVDWWKAATQASGVAIPTQVGDQFRGREFKSFAAFDEALWRTLGEHPSLTSQFDEVNKTRIEQGFAPYAPKNTWVGENREFELRYKERADFWSDPFNLDQISIKTPNSAGGWLGIEPAVVPWPIPPASSWKPLVPPGSEHLGSTTLPGTPVSPAVYPGNPAIPVLPHNETFPAVDEGEIGASIPGFPRDGDLPSPGLVFVGPPVEPLEVGPYNELSGRSRGDGLDIDHIPSRKALDLYIRHRFPEFDSHERAVFLKRAPSIAIPSEVHRRFSETYGGRNHVSKQLEDADDLRLAVDRNVGAVKAGLLEQGLGESEIEAARLKLHKLHIEQGWYQ